MPKMPDCKWYQRPDKVFLTVNVPNVDPAKADMKTTETNFTFKAEDYELAFDFFGEVDSEKATMKVGARDIKFCFPRKEEGEYWGKLNKGAKLGTLKTDFDNWKDEDELDGVDDDMSGFGGMPGTRFSLHHMAECITGKARITTHATPSTCVRPPSLWLYGDLFSVFERASRGESGVLLRVARNCRNTPLSARPFALILSGWRPLTFPLSLSLVRSVSLSCALWLALSSALSRSLSPCLLFCFVPARLLSLYFRSVRICGCQSWPNCGLCPPALPPRAGMGGPGGMGGMDMASMMQGMGGD